MKNNFFLFKSVQKLNPKIRTAYADFIPFYKLVQQTNQKSEVLKYNTDMLFTFYLQLSPNIKNSLCSLANTNDSGVLSGSGGEESSLASASKSNMTFR